MTKQNNNTILWIIGIVILLLVVTNFPVQKETGMIGLTPHYYKDGVEVFPTKGFFGFSIVTPPGGTYDQISFDVYGSNEGDVPIEYLGPINAYPPIFENALPNTYPSTYRTLEVGETNKLLWTSVLMDTIDFESISPVNFWIEVSGKNEYTGETVYSGRTYSGDITFEFEGCISTTPMSWCAPGTPMGVYGNIFKSDGSFYPVGTEIFFVNSDCEKIRIEGDDGEGNYELLHFFINGEHTEVSFNWEGFGILEINVGAVQEGGYTGIHWDTAGSGNANPVGITTNGNYIWIVDRVDDEVYKYNLDGTYTGEHWDTAVAGNLYPYGITTDGNYFWITDWVYDKVYKYNMDGVYTEDTFDISFRSTKSRGITNDGTHFWIVDKDYKIVNKYWMAGHGTGWNFSVSPEMTQPHGITTDGTYLWVTYGWRVYKYFKKHDYSVVYTGEYFNTEIVGDGIYGITNDGNYFWVVDQVNAEVYKYYK